MAGFRVSRKNSVSKIFSRKTRIKQQAQSLLKPSRISKNRIANSVSEIPPGDTEGGYGVVKPILAGENPTFGASLRGNASGFALCVLCAY